MSASFDYDVFLSYSAKDKAVVRPLAERLRADGIKVWFDEWVLKPGDSIPAKIEEGLERSRVLVLCMSTNAFGSDWAQLESGTFRFRDPLNKERRFLPLRLDDVRIKGSLAQFLYINWLPANREQEYPKLLEACRPPPKPVTLVMKADDKRLADNSVQLESDVPAVEAYAFSPDGKHFLTTYGYKEGLWLWDVETGTRLSALEGHSYGGIWSAIWSVDQRYALTGGQDRTVRLWDLATSKCLRVFEGHSGPVKAVALSPDQDRILSCGWNFEVDGIHLWDVETGRCLRVFEKNTQAHNCIAWSPDGRQAASGDRLGGTVRVWSVESGQCLRLLEGQKKRKHRRLERRQSMRSLLLR